MGRPLPPHSDGLLRVKELPRLQDVLESGVADGGPGLRRVPFADVVVRRDGDHLLYHREKIFSLNHVAHTSFFRAAGIPSAYAGRCPTHLLHDQIQHWRGCSAKSTFKNGFFLVDRRGVAVQFLSERESRFSLYDLLGVVQDLRHGEDVQVHHLAVRAAHPFTTLVFPDTSGRLPASGDLVLGGAAVEHDPTSCRALRVGPFLYLPELGVGILPGSVGKMTRHVADDAGNWVPRLEALVDAAVSTFPQHLALLAAAEVSFLAKEDLFRAIHGCPGMTHPLIQAAESVLGAGSLYTAICATPDLVTASRYLYPTLRLAGELVRLAILI